MFRMFRMFRIRTRPPPSRIGMALTLLAFLMPGLGTLGIARADEAEDARADFVVGSERVKEARWAEALEAYERSATKRAHPVTIFNIGVCERALGHATRAERAFKAALAAERETPHVLPLPVLRDAEVFLAETRATLAEVDVLLSPGDAAMLVDGRPLVASEDRTDSGAPVLVAGVADAGKAVPPLPGVAKAAQFRLRADPGTHVLLISRPGFADVVRRETWGPVADRVRPSLSLWLDRLPGSLNVTSLPGGGIVTLDDLDVGTAPVSLERAAGAHHVRVRKPGFFPYEVDVTLVAGQTTSLDAKLRQETPSLLGRWWFWSGVASVVAGAAVITYFVARPAPETPPANGGGLGWVVAVP